MNMLVQRDFATTVCRPHRLNEKILICYSGMSSRLHVQMRLLKYNISTHILQTSIHHVMIVVTPTLIKKRDVGVTEVKGYKWCYK